MSVLQSLPPQVRKAAEELIKIQNIRRKSRMAFIEIGSGVATFIDSEEQILQENSGNVHIENYQGNYKLFIGLGHIPCDNILWYSCINTKLTFELVGFAAKTCILVLQSTDQVDKLISLVKPPPKPRAATSEHDGNVTASSTDSEDSCRGKTDGVNNSFESDDPSIHDSPC